MLVDQLIEFGLSEKEAKAYLALLELGSATPSYVAEKAHINRSSIYGLLDSLHEKGLVSTAYEDGQKVYMAAPPDRLCELSDELATKYKRLSKFVRSMLPRLKTVYKGIGQVQFFEGREGLIRAYEDTLTSTETIRAYASIENMHKAIPGYFPEYYARRASRDIAIRSIHPDTDEAKERVTHDKEEARESALVPKEQYNFSPEINIYDNKIVFMSLVEKFSLIIESQELADAMKKAFDLSWKEAKRLDTVKRRGGDK